MDDVTVVTHLGRSHGRRCQPRERAPQPRPLEGVRAAREGRGRPSARAARPVPLCTLVGGTCTPVHLLGHLYTWRARCMRGSGRAIPPRLLDFTNKTTFSTRVGCGAAVGLG